MKRKILNICQRLLLIFIIYVLNSCGVSKINKISAPSLQVFIDLVQVVEDKIKVTITLNNLTPKTNTFYIPEIVPGTYSDKDYGQYIQDFKAFGQDGNLLTIERKDNNSWYIPNMDKLRKITYWVNDSFDREKEKKPLDGMLATVGTNFEKGDNFYLNMHSIVGYIYGYTNTPYNLEILYPNNLFATTSMKEVKTIEQNNTKISYYSANRYFSIIDNPILIQKDTSLHFQVDDMDIELALFSKSKNINPVKLKSVLQETMKAQKQYLGNLKTTDSYTILLFGLPSSIFSGFGALEHHSSTIGVFNDDFNQEVIEESARDVISHEFFHIVTPLQLHSEYIHDFEYNSPKKMSKHLWLYEGLTEYFANIFLVNQKLITEKEFYARIMSKINQSKAYSDTISFTKMSEHILTDSYKDQYMNVYKKGTLIALALDIQLRELSNGKQGVLDLVKNLSKKYNPNHPFEDDTFIEEITKLTNPSIGFFFKNHVQGNTPISYEAILKKVGIAIEKKEVNTSYFIHTNKEQSIYFDYGPNKGFFFGGDLPLNSWLVEMGVQKGDIIVSVNGKTFGSNIKQIIEDSFSWKMETKVTITIKRDGKEIQLKGNASSPKVIESVLVTDPNASKKNKLISDSWLFN